MGRAQLVKWIVLGMLVYSFHITVGLFDYWRCLIDGLKQLFGVATFILTKFVGLLEIRFTFLGILVVWTLNPLDLLMLLCFCIWVGIFSHKILNVLASFSTCLLLLVSFTTAILNLLFSRVWRIIWLRWLTTRCGLLEMATTLISGWIIGWAYLLSIFSILRILYIILLQLSFLQLLLIVGGRSQILC